MSSASLLGIPPSSPTVCFPPRSSLIPPCSLMASPRPTPLALFRVPSISTARAQTQTSERSSESVNAHPRWPLTEPLSRMTLLTRLLPPLPRLLLRPPLPRAPNTITTTTITITTTSLKCLPCPLSLASRPLRLLPSCLAAAAATAADPFRACTKSMTNTSNTFSTNNTNNNNNSSSINSSTHTRGWTRNRSQSSRIF